MSEPGTRVATLARQANSLLVYLLYLLGLRGSSAVVSTERGQHLLTALAIGLPLSLAFALFNYAAGFHALALVEAAASLLLLPALWLQRGGARLINAAEWLTLAWGATISLALVVFGGVEGSGVLWAFAYPFLAFFLKPQGTAWVVCLAWLGLALMLLALDSSIPAAWLHSPEFKAQLASSLLFATLIAAAFNLVRSRFEQQLAERVAENTSKARAYLEELQYLAEHDLVTGLRNRAGLLLALEAAVAGADPELESIVAVSLRLERLPETFNVVGEDAGDRLVQHVAHALSLRVGEGGVLGRTRLDEFIAFQRIDRALATPDRVMGALRNLPLSFTVDGLPIYLDHVSGSATLPDHTDNARDLLRKAEQAMIQARARRVDTALYDGQLDHNFRQRTRLFGELREALSRESLDIWFQPQFCLRTGKLSGAEALARWIRPDGSMVLPGEFIPLAEQSGLIKPLGELMLRRFFASAAQLRDQGLDLRCSVNLSARNLVDPQTLSVLAKLLAGSGVPADRVVVELTESSFADEPEFLMRTAFELRSMGIRQSIDDFGTGYSSLAYLRELPVDELKIDQVFLRQLDETGRSASLVRAMIEVGHTLGLEVVAEGVENEAAERFLVRHGCDFGQGFLYAPAMPLDQFVDYARRTAPRELPVVQTA
ncbi:MAG: GGDEF domain-containing phosphodiesterase [Proteobacteria bacterium]|nr:GGDEF domain-containing phosphodiesterase [Pseudomonadota bacterium]